MKTRKMEVVLLVFLGSKKRSQVFMNWIKEVYTMYDDASKFVFGFHSEASHHDNNVVETADEDLYNLLKFLKVPAPVKSKISRNVGCKSNGQVNLSAFNLKFWKASLYVDLNHAGNENPKKRRN
jgi:hypothetical protein